MLGGSLHVCSLSRGSSFIKQVSGSMFVIVYQWLLSVPLVRQTESTKVL